MRIAGGPTIIFDAYNASMSGAQATLATFARERVPGRRIVVLGSMAELGDESALMHQRVGAAAAASADIVLVGGDFAASLAVGTQAMGLAPDALITYQTNEEAIAWLREHARPDDFVLLKGSRMYRMEQIVAGLSA
jgi:UDP-N-acetylmuramoyl-tripeptide--D-alanyl-D-alanine ligase